MSTPQRDDLVATMDQWLCPELFRDYCPNGLQVEGRDQVRTVVTGVTASQRFLEQAIETGADMVLVHHGYFWKGEDPCIRGMKQRRIELLLNNNVSLVAYHLPLDAHRSMGNNACLARTIGASEAAPVSGEPCELMWAGTLDEPLKPEELASRLQSRLNRAPLPIEGGPELIRRIGWCSGGAQGMIDRAAALGLDAYLSGEISEPTVHSAREQGIHYFAAGHHATERDGVQALGTALAEAFDIEHCFIEDPSPA
ncbi:Nif3-like dinuclear metal center hexameric protein [Salicola sp. Rm-C-2C1-2]|uniref:Nif3-like dinuclear metal center hexameric protein n=1 Tax=Salicola sp. Rm-C-2C1-2 TaxID=3141321 RepID=UPI0032E38579